MPRFNVEIKDRTVGDAFDITRTVRGIPSGNPITDAYLTVMPNGASDTEATFLFQKHITTSSSATQGVIDSVTSYTITTNGIQAAGSTELIVDPLPTTVSVGSVLQFSGGAWATVTQKALQGATSITVEEIDAPIADNETATYNTARLRFKIKASDSEDIVPNKMHPYDIQITFQNDDPLTIEDGTITLRPQRTIGV